MLRHVGFRMPEHSLRVFKPEFLPHCIGVRVAQLVRHPAVYLEPIARAGDRSPICRPCDLEKLLVRIGRQILLENQLSLGAEVQGSTLPVMPRFVITEFCHPNVSSSVENPAGEFQQFA